MTLLVATAPTVEPITLDEARAQCRVIHHDEDALLAGYIIAARQEAETYLGRTLLATTYDYLVDDWPTFRRGGADVLGIVLPKPPLVSVTSVKYIDTAGVEQTLAANQYRVIGAGDRNSEGIIVPAYGVTWPETLTDYDVVTVRYIAGYPAPSSIPQPIRLALLQLVEHRFTHRGVVLTGTIQSELPYGVKDLLFPWRVMR